MKLPRFFPRLFNNHQSSAIETFPSHIYKIGLFTGQIYLAGAMISHVYNYPYMSYVCCAIYGTTMVHWYKMKHSGIAKTVDIITVILGICEVSFYESYKFSGNGRKIWNSTMLICATSYLFNSVICNFQNGSEEEEPESTEPYNYFSLRAIPQSDIEKREKMYLYSTIIHTFFLHILPISVGAYCVMRI
jgi:hypothetical protein